MTRGDKSAANAQAHSVIEIIASFHLLESATKQPLLPWSLPNLMRKTVFFFVLFHR